MSDLYPRKTGRIGPERTGRVMPEGIQKTAGSSVSGLTPSSASARGTESGNDDSGELRACVWRVGRPVGRTDYRQTGDGPAKGDQLIGVMDTPELERIVVDAVNARRVSVDDDTTLAKALELLACVHDDDECWFDHHGGCRAHGFLDLRPGEKCPQREIGELLAAVQALRGDE